MSRLETLYNEKLAPELMKKLLLGFFANRAGVDQQDIGLFCPFRFNQGV